MTTVFVHGVPDTGRVWARLKPLLPASDAVVLELPGFGCPCPAGFEATRQGYLAWLAAALDAVPGPRDVIAHDWGSILTLRLCAERPDLFRSWVGGGAPLTAGYTWHPTARLWQTPGAGEKAMERLTPELAQVMLMRAGLPEDDARGTAGQIDERMKACILGLYRSGRDVFQDWGADLDGLKRVPGLVVWGEQDAYAEPVYADRLGEATGAKVVRLADCGHWWQVERPGDAAAAIQAFWRGIGL